MLGFASSPQPTKYGRNLRQRAGWGEHRKPQQTTQEGTMRLAVGGDHAGFPLKGPVIEWLRTAGHTVEDFVHSLQCFLSLKLRREIGGGVAII